MFFNKVVNKTMVKLNEKVVDERILKAIMKFLNF